MSINVRNKGSQGERECAKIIEDLLGIKCRRNLSQYQSGGFDLEGLEGWAVEVKRAKKATLPAWWKQTVEQAQAADLKPVLWYRIDHKLWRVVIPLNLLRPGLEYSQDLLYTAELSPEGFAAFHRDKYMKNN